MDIKIDLKLAILFGGKFYKGFSSYKQALRLGTPELDYPAWVLHRFLWITRLRY